MFSAYLRHREEIAALLDPRCYSIEWLDGKVAGGLMTVWGNDKAVIGTEIKQYPAGALEIHGMFAAGELSSILELIEQAENWARCEGIDFAAIASREGWVRVLGPRGYRTHQVELRKDLSDGA